MKKHLSLLLALACVCGLIFFARRTNYAVPLNEIREEDIYYSFLEGERIENGANPYARILDGDMRHNDKYATYFPLFYEASYLSIHFGLDQFDDWLRAWRQIFHGFEYAIALLLFAVFASQKMEWGGAAAAGFWLYNRWTLYIITTANSDFIPIFFMLAAFALYPRKKYAALLLFSISLAFKQIGIFAAPLFVIWAFTAEEKRRSGLAEAAKSAAVIASVPLAFSLPFLVWNAEGFARSILFSVTRLPTTHLKVPSLDAWLGWEGTAARIPLVVLLLAVYWLAVRRIGGKYLPAALAFTVFISFNAVLFNQYFAWLIPFLLLMVVEYKRHNTGRGR
jgi:hypothetical protein